jgi:hypothetical protein
MNLKGTQFRVTAQTIATLTTPGVIQNQLGSTAKIGFDLTQRFPEASIAYAVKIHLGAIGAQVEYNLLQNTLHSLTGNVTWEGGGGKDVNGATVSAYNPQTLIMYVEGGIVQLVHPDIDWTMELPAGTLLTLSGPNAVQSQFLPSNNVLPKIISDGDSVDIFILVYALLD